MSVSSETEQYIFKYILASGIDEKQLNECAQLFSNHYGVWDREHPKAGQNVKLNANALKRGFLFNDKQCGVWLAYSNQKLVGQVFFYYYSIKDKNVLWFTQLVVHSDYRHLGIATELLFKCRSHLPEVFACGLVSSHPYAVRALEKSTKLHVNPEKLAPYAPIILEASQLPYVSNRKLYIDENLSIIDTEYYVDHSCVDKIVEQDKTWKLGKLKRGQEYFAFVIF